MDRWETVSALGAAVADNDTSPISSAALYRDVWTPGVLVVDDNDADREYLEHGLRESGFEVWSCPYGREAAALLLEHGHAIDVVLLDVVMQGREGPEMLAELRAIDPQIRFGFLTEDSGRYFERGLFYLGAHAVFWKPISIHQLVERLRSLAAPKFR